MKVELLKYDDINTVRTLEYIDIQDDIVALKHQIKYNGNIIFNNNGIAYKNDIINLEPFVVAKIIPKVKLFNKKFVELYKTNSFPDNNFYNMIIENSYDDPFDRLSLSNNLDEFILLQYDGSSATIFGLNGENLEHPVIYNHSCYMVTNRDYNLEKLILFLNSREDVILMTDGIEDIPYYNRRDDYIKYIDFKVILKPDQLDLIKNEHYYSGLPSEIIDLTEFKL